MPRIIHGRLLGNRIGRERDFRFGGPLVDRCVGSANIERCPVSISDTAIQASRVNRRKLQSIKGFSSSHAKSGNRKRCVQDPRQRTDAIESHC